jgi:hypothetical protein
VFLPSIKNKNFFHKRLQQAKEQQILPINRKGELQTQIKEMQSLKCIGTIGTVRERSVGAN